MDDVKARKQVVAKGEEHGHGMEPLWMLQVVDVAAERGLVDDLPEKLRILEHEAPYYIGKDAREAIRGMLRRDLERKQNLAEGRGRELGQAQESTPEQEPETKRRRGFGPKP